MPTDIYTPKANVIEREIEKKPQERTTVTVDKGTFYEKYPDVTEPGVLEKYHKGEITVISFPSQLLQNQKFAKYFLGRVAQKPDAFLSGHALETHPQNSSIAVKTLYEQAIKNPKNIECSSREPNKDKIQEATRVTISTKDPVEVDIERHVHLQMALELIQQIQRGSIDNKAIKKPLRRLAETSPGFVTTICCILRYYSPRIREVQLTDNDIFDIVPALTKKRPQDYKLIANIANKLEEKERTSKDDIPTEERINKIISIVLNRFPEEEKKLNAKGDFLEKVRPHMVLESAYNIMQSIYHENNIAFDSKIANRLPPKFEKTVTCRIVTAYTENIPQTRSGQAWTMLTEKKIAEFTGDETTKQPSQNP